MNNNSNTELLQQCSIGENPTNGKEVKSSLSIVKTAQQAKDGIAFENNAIGVIIAGSLFAFILLISFSFFNQNYFGARLFSVEMMLSALAVIVVKKFL